MEPKNPIIIDGVDVSGCRYTIPTTTTNKCGINHWMPCEGYNCYYKQLQCKEKENQRYEQALIVIEDIAKADFNHTCWETYARQLEQILQKISEVIDE